VLKIAGVVVIGAIMSARHHGRERCPADIPNGSGLRQFH